MKVSSDDHDVDWLTGEHTLYKWVVPWQEEGSGSP
jgi:hypothetical protein